MREIKFQAWDKRENRMMGPDELILNGEGKVYDVMYGNLIGTDPFCELRQYTGLKDNHNRGKEIYKGDIVRIEAACGEEYIGEVVWDELRLGWAVDCNDLEELYDFATIIHCGHLVEVIGNAWERRHGKDARV